MDDSSTRPGDGDESRVVQRAKRTYGRRVATELNVSQVVEYSKASSPGVDSNRKESNADVSAASDEEGVELWDWKKRMADIDKMYDSDDEQEKLVAPKFTEKPRQLRIESMTSSSSSHKDNSPVTENDTSFALSSAASAPRTSSSQPLPPSPEISRRSRSSLKGKAIMDSDDDGRGQDKRLSSPTSPDPFPINTPNKRHSSSPPTSEPDIVTQGTEGDEKGSNSREKDATRENDSKTESKGKKGRKTSVAVKVHNSLNLYLIHVNNGSY